MNDSKLPDEQMSQSEHSYVPHSSAIFCLVMLLTMTLRASAQVIPTDVPPVSLFAELNYELPELAKVKAAVDAGEVARAKAALLAHFRARADAQSKPKSNPDYDTRLADNILIGRFIWGDVECSYGPKIEDIQWYKVPEGVYWPLFDHELGRHTFVTTLVNAYRNTGEEKYAHHLIAMLLDFIKKCPVEDGRRMPRIDNADGLAARRIGVDGLTKLGDPSMQWTQMAAMRRLERWPSALQYCIHSDAMTPDALAAILTSMIEQQRYLVDALPFTSPGNHGTRTPTTVIEVAAKLPEIRERDQWVDRAVAELLRRYHWYGPEHPYGFVYPDGATVEICPQVAWGDYGTLLEAMGWVASVGREIPEQFIEIREKMIEYLAYVTWPDEFARRRKRARSVPHLLGRGDLDYIQSGGTEGTRPEHASYPIQSGDPCYAGTYFMRSGWSSEAVVLRVRFGPIQYKYSQHGLGDVGDIGVWGYGMLLLPHLYHHPRTGEFATYGDRSFQGDGRSENTISVDGVGQSRANRVSRAARPLDNPWITTPVFDYVRGSYQFDSKRLVAKHTRAILFVKPDYFVIIDRVDGDDTHHYRMKYQLHHDLTAVADGTQVTGTKGGQPRIVVAPCRNDIELSIIEGQREPYYEGWHLCAPDKAEPAPALIYQWEEQSPARVETVIWPVEPGRPASLNVSRHARDGIISITVERDSRVDVISIGQEDCLTLVRADGDRVLGAGVLGQMSLQGHGLVIEPKRSGAAWLKLADEGGYVASSNCDARITTVGKRIQTIPWLGQ